MASRPYAGQCHPSRTNHQHAHRVRTVRVQMQGDFGNIAGLVGNALNVGTIFSAVDTLRKSPATGCWRRKKRQAKRCSPHARRNLSRCPGQSRCGPAHIAGAQCGHGGFQSRHRRVAHPASMVSSCISSASYILRTLVPILSPSLSNRSGPRCNPRCACPIPWRGKDALGGAHLDQLTQQEERRFIADTRRLLHVVRDHNDGVVFLQLGGQLLHLEVEMGSRALVGSSISSTSAPRRARARCTGAAAGHRTFPARSCSGGP